MKDNLGMFFSSLCIVHCVLTPLLAALGLLGTFALDVESPIIHFALISPVILFAISSLPASKKKHGSITPTLLAFLGISLMLITFFMPEEIELWLMLIASTAVISAHALNKHLLFSHQLLSAK
jgi:hypothetical protein